MLLSPGACIANSGCPKYDWLAPVATIRLSYPIEYAAVRPGARAVTRRAQSPSPSRKPRVGTKNVVPVVAVEKSRMRSWLPGG